MGMKSSKAQQGATTSIQVRFDGGLNYSMSPSQIADNEMCRALNIIYNSQTGTPETRPGTRCVTASALAAPILAIYYYEKSNTESWLVCASGGKLHYLDDDSWVEIGSLNDSTTVPSFLTFNTSLLVADGGTNLKKWDGSALTSLSDGYSSTAIEEAGSRVVINSSTDRDLVIFSGVEDETMWDTADLTNPAIGIRAGFGDNMEVNGFSVFGADLLVSKRGKSDKAIYRISTAGTPTEWSVSYLSGNNCAQSPSCITAAFNNVYFVDTNGFKSIKGVTEYGDLQIDVTGARINTQFNGDVCDSITYIPAYTSLWFNLSDRTYCYHRQSDTNGNITDAFTDLSFRQGRITSVAYTDSELYLAGYNGYLYAIDPTSNVDEVSPAVYEEFDRLIISKRFNMPDAALLKKTTLDFKAYENPTATSAFLRVNTSQQDGILLKEISVLSAVKYLYSATYELASATTVIGDMANSAWSDKTYNRVRGSSIQWQIDSTTGRFGIEGLTAEIALVMG